MTVINLIMEFSIHEDHTCVLEVVEDIIKIIHPLTKTATITTTKTNQPIQNGRNSKPTSTNRIRFHGRTRN